MSDFVPITDLMRSDPTCPPVRRDTVLIAIMHYDRGDHLRLLMESVERNAPGMEVMIIDDGSRDPETVALLHGLARQHTVLVNRADNANTHLRGLHANMNSALAHAEGKGFPYIFFIQEDQQFIRPLDADFFADINRMFRSSAALSQVIPVFFRDYLPVSMLSTRYGIERSCEFYYEIQPAYGIADIGIASVHRLAARGFRFSSDEGSSGTAALRLGMRIGLARNPVLMYTPWPRTTRDHPDNVTAFNLGVNPFEYMTDDEIRTLRSRPVEEFPVAEQHLRTVSPQVRRPWWYTSLTPHSLAEYKGFLQRKAAEDNL